MFAARNEHQNMKSLTSLSVQLLVAACCATGAHAGSLLAVADGNWRGGGWFRQDIKEPKRATKCRFTFNYSPSSNALSISGKCAGGGKSARISGNIVEKSANKFSGRWSATGGFSARDMTGSQSGNRITLSWRAKPRNSKMFENFTARWTISKGRISVSFSVGKKAQDRLSNLVLRR